MDPALNWIRLRSATRPVDGINMDHVTAFTVFRGTSQRGDVLLYVGWTPEGKTPWLRLEGADAAAVIHWLVERGLVDEVDDGGE
jgi:hypothetical protein